MPVLNVALNFPDDQWTPFLDSLGPVNVTLIPPGVYLYKALDDLSKSLGGRPLNIVETGCWRDENPSSLMSDGWSTYYFARWVKAHPGSSLTTIDIENENLHLCLKLLEKYQVNQEIGWVTGDSVELINLGWLNSVAVFFLDSCDGLEHGLAEFKAALEKKPKLIIMDDFATKGAKAFEYALSIGLKPEQVDRYTFYPILQ